MSFRTSSIKKPPIIVYGLLAVVFIACYFLIPQFNQQVDTAFDVLTGEDEERVQRWFCVGIFGPVILIIAMSANVFVCCS